jgi:kynureninase
MKHHLQKAAELDSQDKLSSFRDQFVTDESVIYLDGNSLGRLPKKTKEVLQDIVENQWGNRLIRSWNEHWLDLPKRIAAKLAPIVGASPDEIFVGDSTSVNLYKLALAALKLQRDRSEILTDSLNFPTDLYIFQELINQSFPNYSLNKIPSVDGMTTPMEAIEEALSLETAFLSLSHVVYKSAFMYDMAAVNQLAKENDALTLWDLSHAVGAVDLQLNKSGADMAVGCTYKYLNGGPGAPAFLYVRKELQEQLQNPIAGWFGHKKPFEFDENYVADSGIQRFAAGTPGVLSMAGIEPGLDIMNEAGMENLRRKSIQQSDFLLKMIQSELTPLGFQIASPLDSTSRGSHISIQHANGYRINKAMISPKSDSVKAIIPDFRPPTNIRLGIAPLYNSFTELAKTVERIKKIVVTKEYEQFSAEVEGVS